MLLKFSLRPTTNKKSREPSVWFLCRYTKGSQLKVDSMLLVSSKGSMKKRALDALSVLVCRAGCVCAPGEPAA